MIDIQFRYILEKATFRCEKCGKKIEIDTNLYGDLKYLNEKGNYVCNCGIEYHIPNHYVDTYYNKKIKVGDK